MNSNSSNLVTTQIPSKPPDILMSNKSSEDNHNLEISKAIIPLTFKEKLIRNDGKIDISTDPLSSFFHPMNIQ